MGSARVHGERRTTSAPPASAGGRPAIDTEHDGHTTSTSPATARTATAQRQRLTPARRPHDHPASAGRLGERRPQRGRPPGERPTASASTRRPPPAPDASASTPHSPTTTRPAAPRRAPLTTITLQQPDHEDTATAPTGRIGSRPAPHARRGPSEHQHPAHDIDTATGGECRRDPARRRAPDPEDPSAASAAGRPPAPPHDPDARTATPRPRPHEHP